MGKIASGLASLKKLKSIISKLQLMEAHYAGEIYPIQKWKHFSGYKTEPLI